MKEVCSDLGAWEKIISKSLDIICTIDRYGLVNNINEACKDVLGYEVEEIRGHHIQGFIHPEDLSKTQLIIHNVVNGYNTNSFEHRCISKSGEEVFILWSATWSEEDEVILAIGRDVTERIKNRKRLIEGEQRFNSLFEYHLDMVLFQDREGVIRDVNLATLSFLGLPKQDILNRTFSDFLPAEATKVCNESLQQALKGEHVRYEMAIPFEGKGCFTLDISKIPVIICGEIIGVYSIIRDITDVSLTNKMIEQQAKKLNTILESITDAFIFLDKNWKFRYANTEFYRILQVRNEPLIGRKIWDVLPEELIGQLCRQCMYTMETGKAVHFEAYLEKLNIWVKVKAFPSEEGLSISFEDITDSIQSKQEIEKLSLVASKTNNGVFIADAEGKAEWVNEGFTTLTGYSHDEVIGKKLCAMLQGENTDQATADRIWDSIKQVKPCTEEVLNYKKSGEEIWLSLDVTPISNERGELSRLIVMQTDITHRKETEAQQFQLTQDLFKQNRDLQQFNYIVSHNLRAPVARAMGLAELLSVVDKNSKDFEDFLPLLKTSVDQVDHVLTDLNEILSFSNQQGIIEKVQLASICHQVIANLGESLNGCNGEVITDIDESVFVKGNKAYLHSIFYNLLSNAIKYRSPKRKLKVNIKCYAATDRGIILQISDNGLGFDMKLAADKVFTLYKRFHAKTEGRGIGLYLVKTHIEAMGGHIEVTSQKDVGTNFLIYLP